ncbi:MULTISPECIES: hypothetical protein [unclassified Microcoleus]|uniref:hypothetical protein n=1 Tax=unclassified Microcoleus TaxID=2642155 RepID=UPI002FD02BE3
MNESLAVDPPIWDTSTAKRLCILLNQGRSTAKAVKPDMLQVTITSFANLATRPKR